MQAQVNDSLTLPTLTDFFTVRTSTVVRIQREVMNTMANTGYNEAVLQLIRAVQEQEGAFSNSCDAYENKRIDADALLESANHQFAVIAGSRGFLLQLVDMIIKGNMREKLRSSVLKTEAMVEGKMEAMLERIKELVKDEPATLIWYELTGFDLIPAETTNPRDS